MHVVIYVQHLLGSGHLVRMRLLAEALVSAGQRVTLISGGPFGGSARYDVLQLPPLHTEPGDFSTLLDSGGVAVDAAWKSHRCRILVDHLERLHPDVLVIETWPFGRRQMEFEILPMLASVQNMKPSPRIVCSIRDVLQSRQVKRRRETLAQISRYVSLVLVHGDPEIVDLSASFPEYREISCPVFYTGYIGAPDGGTSAGWKEIVVSAGGGAAGMRLLAVAIAAAEHKPELSWRILVGPRVSEADFSRFRRGVGAHVTVERNRPDFRALLRHCSVSVSQLGYNTAMDLLLARCPAVVIPYAEDGETEQLTRAAIFADKGFVSLLPASELDVASLLSAIDRELNREPLAPICQVDLTGAATSARVICQNFGGRP